MSNLVDGIAPARRAGSPVTREEVRDRLTIAQQRGATTFEETALLLADAVSVGMKERDVAKALRMGRTGIKRYRDLAAIAPALAAEIRALAKELTSAHSSLGTLHGEALQREAWNAAIARAGPGRLPSQVDVEAAVKNARHGTLGDRVERTGVEVATRNNVSVGLKTDGGGEMKDASPAALVRNPPGWFLAAVADALSADRGSPFHSLKAVDVVRWAAGDRDIKFSAAQEAWLLGVASLAVARRTAAP